jgi:HK97 family phage prohead protease
MIFDIEEGIIDFNFPFYKVKTLSNENEFNINLENGRYFYGFASLPVVDSQGDRIELKAIEEGAKDLTKAPYNKIFLGHQYTDIAIGIIIDKKVTKKGLIILAKLNENHERAEEVWKSINEGYLDGFSVGGSFLQVETEYDTKLKKYVNVVKKVVFREVSLTSIPANQEALLVGAFVKSKKIIENFQKDKSEKLKYNVIINKDMEEVNTDNSNEATEEVTTETEPQTNSPSPDNAEGTQEVVETPKTETEEVKEEPKTETEKPVEKEEEKEEVKPEQKPKEKPYNPVKDFKEKSKTPLLDALRKQLEEMEVKIKEVVEENKNLKEKLNNKEKEDEKEEEEKEEEKKKIRKSIPSDSSKFEQDTHKVKTPLLDFLRHS